MNVQETRIIYLSGVKSDRNVLYLPLSSAAVLFLIHYCDCNAFEVVFVNDGVDRDCCIQMSFSVLLAVKYRFIQHSESPHDCDLPGVRECNVVRSGLCSTLRHIVAISHNEDPSQNLVDLLGFRRGSLKACAEDSGWTKLCEIEFPASVSSLLQQIRCITMRQCVTFHHDLHVTLTFDSRGMRQNGDVTTVNLPENVMKLEWHFSKPALVHNDDKHKRALLMQMKQEVQSVSDASEFQFQRDIQRSHCVIKCKINKNCKINRDSENQTTAHTKDCNQVSANNFYPVNDCGNSHKKENSERHPGSTDSIQTLEELTQVVGNLTLDCINFIHVYTEGMEITLSDLILFTYVYFLLQSISFDMSNLERHIPSITKWFSHMITLPRMQQTAKKCQFELDKVKSDETSGKCHISFQIPDDVRSPQDDEMEISRRCRAKYRAIKPDVRRALDKVEKGSISITAGDHPKGDRVQLDWESFPSRVSPGKDLPKKRLQRKCQQLENLTTAVLEIAKCGDIIVDFCSGGGHLGIVVAYMLPKCKVYLVENNEESLCRAKERIKELSLDNVMVYQCNQDYFHGKFNIGMCLHACGVATDMVLQQCIKNEADFVICPCCYGSINDTHFISYPRSQMFRQAGIGVKEFQTLGHAADQTEFNIALEEQGKYCMNLVDTDRAAYAREKNYDVTLCSLKPLTCTPKNNLLIGQFQRS